MRKEYGKILWYIGGFALGILGLRWLLPLVFPFLLGGGLAWLAEPMTRTLCRKLPRSISAGASVTLAFCFFFVLVLLLVALIVRQLAGISPLLPVLEETALSGINTLSGWLQSLTGYLPDTLGTYLREDIQNFFSGGSAMLDKATAWLIGLAGTVLSQVPDSALSICTALISSYMISAKLPQIRTFFQKYSKISPFSRFLSGLQGIKIALGGWLMAQLKLCGITFCILAAGFFILRIRYAMLWAGVVALVDAFPILGTGTVLIPWSLVCLLRGDTARGIGLLGVYGIAFALRSILEPRLVGKELGLDPLITLIALYAGYKLWGFAGMLLSPLVAVVATGLRPENSGA